MKLNDVQKALAEISVIGEMWRQLPFAPRYWVSNCGRVYGTAHKKVLKPECKKYARVYIKTIAGYKHFLIHKLVAMFFLQNYSDFKQVHHIDRNGLNNHCLNLVMVTEQQHHLIHKKSA